MPLDDLGCFGILKFAANTGAVPARESEIHKKLAKTPPEISEASNKVLRLQETIKTD